MPLHRRAGSGDRPDKGIRETPVVIKTHAYRIFVCPDIEDDVSVSAMLLSPPADTEYRLALSVFAITEAILLVVAALLIYTMVRFRRRPADDSRQEPPQVYGSNQIEIAWTIIPILIVFVLVGVITAVEDAKPPLLNSAASKYPGSHAGFPQSSTFTKLAPEALPYCNDDVETKVLCCR